jgi:hypothetical protein
MSLPWTPYSMQDFMVEGGIPIMATGHVFLGHKFGANFILKINWGLKVRPRKISCSPNFVNKTGKRMLCGLEKQS